MKFIAVASITVVIAATSIGVARILLSKPAAQSAIGVTPSSDIQVRSAGVASAPTFVEPSLATSPNDPRVTKKAAMPSSISTPLTQKMGGMAEGASPSINASGATVKSLNKDHVSDTELQPATPVAAKPPISVQAVAPINDQQRGQVAQLRSHELTSPQPNHVVPSADSARAQSEGTDTVVVSAQRVQQVAHVDIESTGRGNSLTINLPKRRR
jgi:hypothetical protein